jgi:hypothetical protein
MEAHRILDIQHTNELLQIFLLRDRNTFHTVWSVFELSGIEC